MARLAAVAGTFYPADKNSLINQIKLYLVKAKNLQDKRKSSILIVPHAGLDYSGQTAAWGFKQIEGKNYSKIILIGASHQAYFNKAAVYNKGFWQTPIGKVKIDETLANNLINQSNLTEENLEVHNQEHCLEIGIPFLQILLNDFKITPILLSKVNNELLESLSTAIVSNFDSKTLLVVSSDLSHYPAYEIANKVDKATIDGIVSGDINIFTKNINKNQNLSGVDTCACGAEAIKLGIMTAQKLGIKSIKLLNYSNSADAGGDKFRVVGYASIGFYEERLKISNTEDTKNPKDSEQLNKKSKEALLRIARETLESYLKAKKIPKINCKDKQLNKRLGAFVTLKKQGKLRGCIGEFEPKKPLFQVIQEKVVESAFRDPRFFPVQLNELKDIEIEISVLSPKIRIKNWRHIKLGVHGVIVKKGFHAGTFLPQVAWETGWDLETFLNYLCIHKAGLAPGCYKDSETEIYIFTAQVFGEGGEENENKFKN